MGSGTAWQLQDNGMRAGPTATRDRRLAWIDGVRGWGAIVVLLYHSFVDAFPLGTEVQAGLARLLLFNGMWAVLTFFVASGFALSYKYLVDGDGRALASLAIGRYFRLAIPIGAACTVVFVLMIAGGIPAWQNRPPSFNGILQFTATIRHLISFSLWEVFADFSFDRTFIGPLWVMPIEFIGSMLVFAAIACLNRTRGALAAYLGLFAILFAFVSFYSLFAAGLIAAYFHTRGRIGQNERLAACLGLLCIAIFFVVPARSLTHFHLIGTLAGFAAVLFSAKARHFLAGPLSRKLGEISFPLYLIHGPVMFAVSVPFLNWVRHEGLSNTPAALLAALITLPASIIAAFGFSPVNVLAIRVARAIGNAAVSVICNSIIYLDVVQKLSRSRKA
jgi:peptidoglycan/LPS O-acetylase OafA/YrhL